MGRPRQGESTVNEIDRDDALSERVAASVRRALALVGPAESGMEQVNEEAEEAG